MQRNHASASDGKPARNDRPIDLVHLARHTMGDPELEREVLQLFVTQAKIYLTRLKEAGNARMWRETAHTIKGAARGIGAWQVAEQAEQAELLSFDPEDRRCRTAIAAVESEIDSATRFIRSLFTAH